MLGAIWAQSLDRVIGDGSGMPWHVPEDLAHFKSTTLGDPVIMGRRTWESLNPRFRPLPGRENIILSSRAPGEWSSGAEVVTELGDRSGWIMGGGVVYAATLALVSRLEITLIDAHLSPLITTAVLAPEISDDFEQVADSGWKTSEHGSVEGAEGPARYRFLSYQRKDSTS